MSVGRESTKVLEGPFCQITQERTPLGFATTRGPVNRILLELRNEISSRQPIPGMKLSTFTNFTG